MKNHRGIHHIAITVGDIKEAMQFFRPFLELLGYKCLEVFRDTTGREMYQNLHSEGGLFNVWPADQELKDQRFEVYAPGLHHIGFCAESREQVDRCHELVVELGAEVLAGPGEFYAPYYYSFYFLGPSNLKFEVMHVSNQSDD